MKKLSEIGQHFQAFEEPDPNTPISEVWILTQDERRELVRAVWYISRRETLRECANLGRAPRIEEFFELEGL